MYTLRIIEETRENENSPFQNVIENFELGNSYSILKNGDTKEFDNLLKRKYPESSKDEIKAIVCGQNEWDFFIFKDTENEKFSYFIMTESGKTFERL